MPESICFECFKVLSSKIFIRHAKYYNMTNHVLSKAKMGAVGGMGGGGPVGGRGAKSTHSPRVCSTTQYT